jgi:hypothetical protein
MLPITNGKKTILSLVAIILIAAASLMWSKFGPVEQEKANAAEVSLTASPIEMMSKARKDMPVEDVVDPF